MTDQPEALRVAEHLELYATFGRGDRSHDAARLLREQHAEIERLRAERNTAQANLASMQIGWENWRVTHSTAFKDTEIERLREQLRLANIDALNEAAENEALRRDAERYRWLRDKAPPDIGDIASVRDSHDPSEIDAAIDAARGEK